MKSTTQIFLSHRDLDISETSVIRSKMRLELCEVDSLGGDAQLVVGEGEGGPASEIWVKKYKNWWNWCQTRELYLYEEKKLGLIDIRQAQLLISISSSVVKRTFHLRLAMKRGICMAALERGSDVCAGVNLCVQGGEMLRY